MSITENKRIKVITKCFNHISKYTFEEIKDPIDRMQAIHDIAMMLEGFVLMKATPTFIPKAMKDIERDIKNMIKFHNQFPNKEE